MINSIVNFILHLILLLMNLIISVKNILLKKIVVYYKIGKETRFF